MTRIFERSLLLRLGLAMAGITLLALLGMGSSVVIAEMMRGEAAAINQAGSLRMQSYLIAVRVLSPAGTRYAQDVGGAVREFDRRLHSPRLVDALRMHGGSLQREYARVAAHWRDRVRPPIDEYVAGASIGLPPAAARASVLDRIDTFVPEIDRLVKHLENDAEAKINLLRLIQGVSLFLTFGIAYVTMYLTYRDVVTPLKDLLAFAERARRGDFSARPQHTGGDELGRLGRAFDVMAEDLSRLYGDLESRVAAKTADLTRSNRSLELLYNTTKRLSEGPLSPAVYEEIVREVEKILELGPGWLCVAQEDEAKPITFAPHRDTLSYCDRASCDSCLTGEGPRSVDGGTLLSVPLRDRECNQGVLLLRIPAGTVPAPWQVQLLEAVGRHIGLAIGTARRAVLDRRLALLEERQVIARELHDSLAQSLSYLKIQLGRLRSVMGSASSGPAATIVEEMRMGVNDAYRQLRELLTTFRLRMDGRGLGAALAATIDEFSSRSAVTIALDNALQGCPLSVNEEIHVLQIAREALANVVRHARAKHARVTAACEGRTVRVIVDDDGVGIAETSSRPHHYGLSIMQERARGLGGELSIRSRPEAGTRVSLHFVPATYLARPLAVAGQDHGR